MYPSCVLSFSFFIMCNSLLRVFFLLSLCGSFSSSSLLLSFLLPVVLAWQHSVGINLILPNLSFVILEATLLLKLVRLLVVVEEANLIVGGARDLANGKQRSRIAASIQQRKMR